MILLLYIIKVLDLTEILKGCEGVELWSDIFGKCKLLNTKGNCSYKIEVQVIDKDDDEDGFECFISDGKFYAGYTNGKCMLWPSETNRDWSTFKKPIKDDDWVACCDRNNVAVILRYKDVVMKWEHIIPFEKYNPTLTDEELKKLSIV